MSEKNNKSNDILKKGVKLNIDDYFYIKISDLQLYFCDENGNTNGSDVTNETDNVNINENSDDFNDLNMIHNVINKDISIDLSTQKNKKNNQIVILGNGYMKPNLLMIGGFKYVGNKTEEMNLIMNRYTSENNVTKKWIIYQTSEILKITCPLVEQYLHNTDSVAIFKLIFTSNGFDISHYKNMDQNEMPIKESKQEYKSNDSEIDRLKETVKNLETRICDLENATINVVTNEITNKVTNEITNKVTNKKVDHKIKLKMYQKEPVHPVVKKSYLVLKQIWTAK